MSCFLSELHVIDLDGRFKELEYTLMYYSSILGCTIYVPMYFITDYESVPLFRSHSDKSGTIHDYLCRINAWPKVSKKLAAKVYLEAQEVEDLLNHRNTWRRKIWRKMKYIVVHYWHGYFKKHKVNATYKEIKKDS